MLRIIVQNEEKEEVFRYILKEDAIVLIKDMYDSLLGPGFTIGFDDPIAYFESARSKGYDFEDDVILVVGVIGKDEYSLDSSHIDIVSIIIDQLEEEDEYPTTLELFKKLKEAIEKHGKVTIYHII